MLVKWRWRGREVLVKRRKIGGRGGVHGGSMWVPKLPCCVLGERQGEQHRTSHLRRSSNSFQSRYVCVCACHFQCPNCHRNDTFVLSDTR